jgi:glucosamine kinase
MNIFLGIDGGGSHTRAMIVSQEGKILGTAQSGPSNYHNVGLDAASREILQATKSALQEAGQKLSDITYAYLGCAGIKSSLDKSRLRSRVETEGLAPNGEILVENDLWNALAGGLSGRPGIALIAGTGSNCVGRNQEGKSFMCGGWGWILDDQGSAMGLTLTALRQAVRAADGRSRPTRLLDSALAFLGLSEVEEILAKLLVDDWTPDQLASFAPVIMRAATDGDRIAGRVLEDGAAALAELVAGVNRQLSFHESPEIVLLGGCLRSGPPYQPLVEAAITKAVPEGKVIEPEASPLDGAALNALLHAGVSPLPRLFS